MLRPARHAISINDYKPNQLSLKNLKNSSFHYKKSSESF